MEGISGKHPLAQIWMHTGWVTVKGEKMSKSLSNFIRIEDILKNHSPEALRLLMLQTSYQSPLEYSEELIQAAENVIQNIRKIYARLHLVEKRSGEYKSVDIMKKNLKAEVEDSMNDNFNTPKALLALYNLIDWTEQLFLEGTFGSETIKKILNIFDYFEKIFGIIPPEIPIPDDIREKAKHREKLRAEKKWAESDAIRAWVFDLGYELSDTPDGTIILLCAPRG
jgi:cysteinyl-tRNA synthetase